MSDVGTLVGRIGTTTKEHGHSKDPQNHPYNIPICYNTGCVRMAEWTIATVCKTVALTGYPGSNPGPDTYAR